MKFRNFIKENKKYILFIIIEYIAQSLSYLFFQGDFFMNRAFLLISPFDDALPFIGWFVWFYVIWYAFMALVPLMLVVKDKDKFYKYMTTLIICIVICNLVYLIFPTTIIRYDNEFLTFSDKIVQFAYSMDRPICCLPSIHCLTSFLFIVVMFRNTNINKYLRIGIEVVSVLIVLSTMFIKQHVIYDAITALVIVLLVYFIVSKFNLQKFIKKLIKD